MKNLHYIVFTIVVLIPYLIFSQSNTYCDGDWIEETIINNCSSFNDQVSCENIEGCSWEYSWGGWVTGGSNDCLGGQVTTTNIYCDGEIVVLGCTDINAINFNPLATENDGTCIANCTEVYVEVSSGAQDDEIGWNIAQSNGWAILSGAVGATSTCIQDGCWTFNMYDGGGDGWAGSIITISTEEEILFSGTLNDGTFEVNSLQIGNSIPCEEINFGCEYEGELFEFGSSIEQDCNSCYCQAGFNPNENGIWACTEQDCSFGCTDQSASNYAAYAIEDDGSCIWLDCDNEDSYTSLNILVEDSVCHSNLYCEDYNWDGGDCVFDCNDDLMSLWDIDSYFYNGECDQILNCMFYNFDNESCIENTNSGCDGISITINTGWNMIGFSCSDDLDAIEAFYSIQDKIVIAKDIYGNAYLPSFNFNGIGDLERGYGYLLKVTEQINNYNICE